MSWFWMLGRLDLILSFCDHISKELKSAAWRNTIKGVD